MVLTELEKKRLNKLQEAANRYHEAREAHSVAGVRLARVADKVFSDFEKFWTPIRKRESAP